MLAQPPKRIPPFSAEEFGLRTASLRQGMAQRELDALILSDPANIAWLTGYDAAPTGAHQAVILTMEDAPRWWGADIDRPGAAATVWMEDARLETYAETGRDTHPFADLAAQLKSWNLGKARIGLELDSPFCTAACIGQMLAELPNAQYVDATGLADWRRVVKSEAEIALMRRAAELVDAAHERVAAEIEAGRPKSALIAEIAKTLVWDEDGAELYGGPIATPPLCLAGAEAGAAGLGWTGAPLKEGEPAVFALAAAVRRYHCVAARAVFLGEPSEEDGAIATRAADALDAAIDAARPGAPAGAVADAFYKALGADTPAAKPAIGFSVGLACPPRWRERSLRVEPGEGAELLEGMTLTLIAGPAQLGAALQISETVLIGAKTAEPLCKTPREMAVKYA